MEREKLLEVAEAIAPGWERRRGFVEEVCAPLREWMVEALAPAPGDTVLELAAGAGDTGFDAAALLGEGGRLISTDFSPAMVEVARRRGTERGAGNVEYRVMDAERIELEDDSVDGVLCRLGYMLMADPAAALAETRRVLRPSGRLALAVWGEPQGNPFFAAAALALVERGHMPPLDPAVPGVFSLGDAERVRSLLGGAGFEQVRVEELPMGFAFPDLEEYLAIVADTAGPLAVVLRGLSEGERGEVEAGLRETFAPFAGGAGYELPGVALVAVAG